MRKKQTDEINKISAAPLECKQQDAADIQKNIDVAEITDILAKSLDNTQKNATDSDQLVQQILDLSDHDSHKKAIDGILADETLNWDKKVDLMKKVDIEYDQREERNTQRVKELQSTQAQNVNAATAWLAKHWYCVAGGFLILLGVFTPGGRKCLLTAGKFLITAKA